MYEEQRSKLKYEHRAWLRTDLITNTTRSQQWPLQSAEVKWRVPWMKKKKNRGRNVPQLTRRMLKAREKHRLSFSSSRTDNGPLTAHKGGKHTQTALFPLYRAYLSDAAAPDKQNAIYFREKNHSRKKSDLPSKKFPVPKQLQVTNPLSG